MNKAEEFTPVSSSVGLCDRFGVGKVSEDPKTKLKSFERKGNEREMLPQTRSTSLVVLQHFANLYIDLNDILLVHKITSRKVWI